MAAVVGIISRHGLTIIAHHRSQPNESKLALYKPLLHFYSHLKQLYMSNKMDCFSYRGICGIHGHTHFETILYHYAINKDYTCLVLHLQHLVFGY